MAKSPLNVLKGSHKAEMERTRGMYDHLLLEGLGLVESCVNYHEMLAIHIEGKGSMPQIREIFQ